MLRLIEIFRPGRHVSASGEALTFSEADVAAIAAGYDPEVHRAPLVVGHPKDNSPAFGHASSLAVHGGKLLAAVDQIDPSFAEAVNAKRYPKVSASFYRPSSPANPKPGAYYLRHIGFLGGMPPAVKGLADASFAGTADDMVTVEFAEGDPPAASSSSSSTATTEPAPPEPSKDTAVKAAIEAIMKSLPEALDADGRAKVEKLLNELLTDKKEPESPEYAERRRQLEEGERQLAADRRALRRTQNAAFLNGLREKGVMLPVSQETALSFMDLLHDAPRDVVSFGERETRTPDAIFRDDFIARIPPAVVFAEVGARGGNAENEDPEALGRRAAAYRDEQRAKGHHISQTQAVHELARQR